VTVGNDVNKLRAFFDHREKFLEDSKSGLVKWTSWGPVSFSGRTLLHAVN